MLAILIGIEHYLMHVLQLLQGTLKRQMSNLFSLLCTQKYFSNNRKQGSSTFPKDSSVSLVVLILKDLVLIRASPRSEAAGAELLHPLLQRDRSLLLLVHVLLHLRDVQIQLKIEQRWIPAPNLINNLE